MAPKFLLLLTGAWALSPEGMVDVRFTNTKNLVDVRTSVPEGTNLLNVGDAHGIKIPRACRNGLCGTCICDVVNEDTGERTTIKACSTTLQRPVDGDEIVVDLFRMRKGADHDVMVNSMRRFDDGWENEFVPDYKARGVVGSFGDDDRDDLAPWEKNAPTQTYTKFNQNPPPAITNPEDPLYDDPDAPPWERIW